MSDLNPEHEYAEFVTEDGPGSADVSQFPSGPGETPPEQPPNRTEARHADSPPRGWDRTAGRAADKL